MMTRRRVLIHFVGWLTIVFFVWRPVLDPDLGWHLETGRSIWEGKKIDRVDRLSFATPGVEFVAHSWLLDLGLWGANVWLGLWGVGLIYAGLLAMGIGIGWQLGEKVKRRAGDFLGLAGWSWLMVEVIGLRSQVVSLTGLVLVWFLLEKVEKASGIKSWGKWLKASVWWILPLLMWWWANSHAGVVLGLMGLWSGTIYLIIKRQKEMLENVLIGASVVVGSIVTVINPYGLKIFELAAAMVSNDRAAKFNTDWLPLLSEDLPHGTIWLRIGIIVICLWVILSKETGRTTKVVVGALLLLAMSKVRYLLPLMVVLTPQVKKIWQSWELEKTGVGRAVVLGGLVVAVIMGVNQVNLSWCAYTEPECYAKLGNYPYQAVEFVKSNKNKANILNHYTWGGYISWRWPEAQIFIDGRMDNFRKNERAFIDEYVTIIYQLQGWEEVISEYEIDAVIIPKEWKSLIGGLIEIGWTIEHEDELAVVLFPK